MDHMTLLFIVPIAVFTATAAVSDFRTRRLPNRLTVPAFAAAVIMHTAVNGFAGLAFSLGGFATGFAVLLVLWLIGGGGGGDVKLMGALGAWLGAGLTLQVFFAGTILAAMATGAILLWGLLTRGYVAVQRRYLATGSGGRKRRRKPVARRDRQIQRQRRRLMPFAVPVALGTWLVLAAAWKTAELPW